MLANDDLLTPEETRWRDLYWAAIFEPDRTRLSARIAEAEFEIARARMLFNAPGDNSDEWDALDDALYTLRALKNSLMLENGDKLAA